MTDVPFRLPDPKGVDPFDALRSPRLPEWVRRHPRARQLAIQARKRLPIDLSSLLHIEPFVMAKTLGCHLTALCRAQSAAGALDVGAVERVIDSLRGTEGNLGQGAWGYEFDVQTRWAYYPAGSANLIATAFVGRALCAAGAWCRNEAWAALGCEAARYALQTFSRSDGSSPLVFYYTQDAAHLVHNANLLGAALCASATASEASASLAESALSAALASVRAQRADGSWPYGDSAGLEWVDSFHTAYNLDGLLQTWLLTGDAEVLGSLELGVSYWESRFFGPEGEPWYFDSGRPPCDIHAAATAVDVGSRLASWGLMSQALPRRVAAWTRANLIDPLTGATYYRKGRLGVDRRHFARWGDAHWALARSSVALLDAGAQDPLEVLLRGGR